MKNSLRLDIPLAQAQLELEKLKPPERLQWGYSKFGKNFCITTSFGIQSAVLLHMTTSLDKAANIPVIWVDTGYLPKETYSYAEQLTNALKLNLIVVQSSISPARMEALYGQLWKTNSVKDLEKYHSIRKIKPLEESFAKNNIFCWASGVRGKQTKLRSSMNWLDPIRSRLSLLPILNWTQKDIYYYMQENELPEHPLFQKGYSTVGDWHSSKPDGPLEQGRKTRFSGLKEECGLHQRGVMGDGI